MSVAGTLTSWSKTMAHPCMTAQIVRLSVWGLHYTRLPVPTTCFCDVSPSSTFHCIVPLSYHDFFSISENSAPGGIITALYLAIHLSARRVDIVNERVTCCKLSIYKVFKDNEATHRNSQWGENWIIRTAVNEKKGVKGTKTSIRHKKIRCNPAGYFSYMWLPWLCCFDLPKQLYLGRNRSTVAIFRFQWNVLANPARECHVNACPKFWRHQKSTHRAHLHRGHVNQRSRKTGILPLPSSVLLADQKQNRNPRLAYMIVESTCSSMFCAVHVVCSASLWLCFSLCMGLRDYPRSQSLKWHYSGIDLL